MRMSRIGITSVVVAAMVAGGTGLAVAGTSRVRVAVSGTEHLSLMTTLPNASKFVVIASGVFTAGGTDVSGGSIDVVKTPAGSFKLNHGGAVHVLKERFSRKTCLAVFAATAKFTLEGGTGAYKGISGSGKGLINETFIARRSKGQCNPNATPLVAEETITGVAHQPQVIGRALKCPPHRCTLRGAATRSAQAGSPGRGGRPGQDTILARPGLCFIRVGMASRSRPRWSPSEPGGSAAQTPPELAGGRPHLAPPSSWYPLPTGFVAAQARVGAAAGPILAPLPLTSDHLLGGPEPEDITGAQLSQYTGAMKSDFKDPDVLAVARKVQISEFPDPPAATRHLYRAVKSPPLTIKTTGAKTYTEELKACSGVMPYARAHDWG
jgi:hypothetical protein